MPHNHADPERIDLEALPGRLRCLGRYAGIALASAAAWWLVLGLLESWTATLALWWLFLVTSHFMLLSSHTASIHTIPYYGGASRWVARAEEPVHFWAGLAIWAIFWGMSAITLCVRFVIRRKTGHPS